MSKQYIRCTTTYIVPVIDLDPGQIDPVVSQGMQIMEEIMAQKAGNIVEIWSTWQMMPKSWQPKKTKPIVDAGGTPIPDDSELGPQVSFTDVGGVTHPWDQGLWIFPVDSPMHALEEAAHAKWTRGDDSAKEAFTQGAKELEAGDE